MSLTINILSSEDEQNLEEIKEELKEVNERIIQTEKRLVSANRSLTHLYSADKGLERALENLDDEERESCERQINNFGETSDALESARNSHEQHVNALRQQIEQLTERHERKRNDLKSNLLYLKQKISPTKNKKKIAEYEEELDQVLNKQSNVEKEVIRLRTKHLQQSLVSTADQGMQQSNANANNGVRVIELRERHSRTEHQLQQMRNFLAQQSAEKQQLAHVIAQAAAKNMVLDAELKSLQSDLNMANFEYTDVCREYREEQRKYRSLRARVDDALTFSHLPGLTQRRKEVIWRVITLDASSKREKQRCKALKDLLYGQYSA